MINSDVILRAEGISKYFYDPVKFRVLHEVSFDAQRGEFLSLVGKSGSGKSTLLYCLSTMDTDYEGRITIDGQLVTGRKKDELAALRNSHIGFIFQFHYLLPEFSCLRNVMLPALRLGRYPKQEVEARAYHKLELLGLADQAQKPASKLSGGQQQRVAIARALINDPQLILCDEPTGNLDSRNARIVFDTFQELAHTLGHTIICVTHDTEFAAMSDRIIELTDGTIVS